MQSKWRNVIRLAWHVLAVVGVGLAGCLGSGCALLSAREQSRTVDTAGTIEGLVKVTSPQEGPVVVLRLQRQDGMLIVRSRMPLPPSGQYRFTVLPGDYVVVAFIDANGNGLCDAGEHGMYHPGPAIFSIAARQTVVVPPLTISGVLPAPPADVKLAREMMLHTRNTGKVTTLDDPVFSPENCAMGMWQPMDFLKQVGGGLFMLQEYDPARMPVIFVHGMGGGPRDWKAAIAGLDRTRVQPWVLFYPGGIRLDMLSDAFAREVKAMGERYRFERLGVVAHSMGGLVTRSFVKKYTTDFPEANRILRFVMTVNSPMAGLASAASGVQHSPIVLPAWRDVATGSEFLKDLYAWRWPRELPYHLVFSYQEGDSSDGTIPLQSQIPLGLQAEATRLYGFNDTHVGTLSNERFLDVFNRIIDRETR